jgi:hypothetical protein
MSIYFYLWIAINTLYLSFIYWLTPIKAYVWLMILS